MLSLEKEASEAKKKQHDLFQRKSKLIPKFQKMLEILRGRPEIASALPKPSFAEKELNGTEQTFPDPNPTPFLNVYDQFQQKAPTNSNQIDDIELDHPILQGEAEVSSDSTTPTSCCDTESSPSPERLSLVASALINNHLQLAVQNEEDAPTFAEFNFSNTSGSSPELDDPLYIANEVDFCYLDLEDGPDCFL